MLITENIKINNHDYIHNYSDAGFYIERDEILYADALDPAIYERKYKETDIKIETKSNEESDLETYAKAGKILLGEEV